MIQASDGNLYGTAGSFRPGTVFKFELPNSWFTTLHNFPSGIFPLNRVTQASNGLLYGSTRPTNATNGSFVVTIFPSTLTGNVQSLQQLTLPAKKQFAVGPFLQATHGNLWDTSYVGGTSGLGIAFAITPSGGIVDTLSFSPAAGVSPIGGVIQAKDGTLFGTASADGTVRRERRQTGRCTRSRGFRRSSETGAGEAAASLAQSTPRRRRKAAPTGRKTGSLRSG